MPDASYATFKRDQVERAIAIVTGISPKNDENGFKSLQIELKRLLDRDRKQASETPRGVTIRQAFHDAPPPGRGFDVMYSGYEAFALLIALRLMRSGFTQATAVQFLRDLRVPLAGVHYEILHCSPQTIRPKLSEEKRNDLIRNGFLMEEPKHMTHLVALAGEKAEAFDMPSPEERPVSGNICRDLDQLHGRLRWASHYGHPLIVIELTNAAYQLAHHLARIEPRSRGRQ